ncbi:period circadian protein [Rhynchospora pubera]|uniref:Period circadian protein n=1 Tax=Rhynchospora pubera TaxID=906938 RepID=A0AAV8CTR6_9POAL|nr:period circadian protein [Rhynchospora pubera]
MENMKLASKVILLFHDPDGFGSSMAAALHPKSESDIIRQHSSFEIALDKYGANGSQVSGDLIQFLGPDGSLHVSILVLPNYAPPVAACAMNEILSLISSHNPSKPTIIIPLTTKITITPGIALYGAVIGSKTEFSRNLIEKTAEPPSGLKIYSEPVTCLVQMAPVLDIAMVLLFGARSQVQSGKSNAFDHETICKVGEHLATHINLEFKKEVLKEIAQEKPSGAQEMWRDLYG